MTNFDLRGILGSRNTRALGVLVLVGGLASPLLVKPPATYAVHVKQTISKGSVVAVSFNDFGTEETVLVPASPDQTVDYAFSPWHGPITRVRIDPTDVEDANIAINDVEIYQGDVVVKSFSAADISSWVCDGVERRSASAGTLQLRSTTNDPICISPTLDLPAAATARAPINHVMNMMRLFLGWLPLMGALLLAFHMLVRMSEPEAIGDSAPTATFAAWLKSQVPLIFIYSALGTVLSLRLGQDMNYDLRNYHFYNPYLLLANRFDRDVQAAGIQTFLSPTFDLLIFIAIRIWRLPAVVIGGVLGAFHGLALWLVHVLATLVVGVQRRGVTESLGAFSATIAAFGAGYRGELGTTFGDNTFAVFVLAALAIVLASVNVEPKGLRLVRLGGLLAGIAAGGKLVAGSYVVGLGAAMIFARPTWRQRFVWLGTFSVLAATGVLLSGGYWMWLLQSHYQSPVFPFFNTWFRSPFASTAANFDLAAWYAPPDQWAWWFLPFMLVGKQELLGSFRDPRLAAATVALMMLAVGFWFRSVASAGDRCVNRRLAMMAMFSVVSYAVWLNMFAEYRFAIPLELVSGVIIVGCAAFLVRKESLLVPTVLVIGTLLVVLTTPIDWGRVRWSSSYFGVNESQFQPYGSATILLWGQPNSYLIPYFPSTATFVRPLNLEGGPDPDTAMFRQLVERIAATPKVFSLETPPVWPEYRNAMLDRLGIAIDHTQCQFISTAADTSRICAVVRRR